MYRIVRREDIVKWNSFMNKNIFIWNDLFVINIFKYMLGKYLVNNKSLEVLGFFCFKYIFWIWLYNF